MSDADLTDPELRDRAVAAAMGRAPFDLLIRGGRIACPVTHTLRQADVGIVGALIASVHAPDQGREAAVVIEADGLTIAPGFIDTHMHVESSMVTPAAYAAAMLPRGVTTAVWDPHEFANVAGRAGMDYALGEADASPLRFLPLVPSCVPAAPGYEVSGADFGPDVIADLLAEPGTFGLAEVMDMAAVTGRADRMRGIVQAALASGKMICGHARSLEGGALQAYAASGIASDHELTSPEDLRARLEAGMTIELRGSHDHLLPGFAEVLEALPQLPPTVTLCTDDVFPDDLAAAGGLDDVLRRLMRYGLSPMRALQAATLNGALRIGRPDLGLVGPGKRADLVLMEDLASVSVVRVIRDGAPVRPAAPEPRRVPPALLGTMRCDAPSPEEILPRAEGARVRVATIERPRFTQWGETVAEVRDGRVQPPKDATLISVLHRHGRGASTPRTGFLTGWGRWRGAFGTTVSHDSHNLTLFGARPEDLAVAAEALIACGGGMVAVKDGRVSALLPLPVAGLVSDAPLAEIAAGFTALKAAMDEIVEWNPPYLVFKALVGATLACNAGPHQTDLGIADPLAGRLLPSPVLGPA
ncbi:adenine deaminase [Tropicimonas sp. IMCC34011]|uniref:adenine deaminase n=1 Tax=Tropicimonas sp. IMCC34011 TaxID=2248759 RepID=UPI000E2282DF|nr:adenine deaminase C-terminal domain-containing protein [Tropicimonas sp. IMCC34011]